MLKNEWKSLLKNKILLIVIAAVILIPVDLRRTVSEIHVGPIRKSGQTSRGGSQS